jgi:hypothetical protein
VELGADAGSGVVPGGDETGDSRYQRLGGLITAVQPTLRCLCEDLGLPVPAARMMLDEVEHLLLVKAGEQFPQPRMNLQEPVLARVAGKLGARAGQPELCRPQRIDQVMAVPERNSVTANTLASPGHARRNLGDLPTARNA